MFGAVRRARGRPASTRWKGFQAKGADWAFRTRPATCKHGRLRRAAVPWLHDRQKHDHRGGRAGAHRRLARHLPQMPRRRARRPGARPGGCRTGRSRLRGRRARVVGQPGPQAGRAGRQGAGAQGRAVRRSGGGGAPKTAHAAGDGSDAPDQRGRPAGQRDGVHAEPNRRGHAGLPRRPLQHLPARAHGRAGRGPHSLLSQSTEARGAVRRRRTAHRAGAARDESEKAVAPLRTLRHPSCTRSRTTAST